MSEVLQNGSESLDLEPFTDPASLSDFAGLKSQLGVHNVEKYKGEILRSCKRTYKLPNGETVTNCNQLKLLAADGKSARGKFCALVTCAGSNFRLGVVLP